MAYHYEKDSGELIIDGFEQGISPSPHKGIANIQNANLSTEMGEVMNSFGRFEQSQQVPSSHVLTGTLTASTSTSVTGTVGIIPITVPLTLGVWITTGTSSITGISSNTVYFVKAADSNGSLGLSTSYGSSILTGLGVSGTCPFTLNTTVGLPVAKAVEPYGNGTTTINYRYYILDNAGLVWVFDTALFASSMTAWFCPDFQTAQFNGTPTGMCILNGWILIFVGFAIYGKQTVCLGNNGSTSTTYVVTEFSMTSSTSPHFAYVGNLQKCYYTDGAYVGGIYPTTEPTNGVANIQSYCSYTATTTTGTITSVVGGSIPSLDVSGGSRIPAVFFPAPGGNQPSNLTAGTVYWIALGSTFNVFANQMGGTAINIASGASGTQYFNTFFPISTGGAALTIFTPIQVFVSYSQISTYIAEINNTIIIGGTGNLLSVWNQVDVSPSAFLSLPESGVATMINVHNMMYVFAGNKGNIYITDGSVISHVYAVPDYCAGIAGTATTYYEPSFVWGDAMYLRGRIYFSILDQTQSSGSQIKAGNCGGIWSFVPTQNFYIQQDVGISLVLENKSSYGTYNGYAPILIPSFNQAAIAPQYWSGWESSNLNNASFGIDFTNTFPTSATVIETDLIPTGEMLGRQKKKFNNLELKFSTPIISGETTAVNYRLNRYAAWSSAGTLNYDKYKLSAYISPHKIPQGQWLQLQVINTPNGTSTFSGMSLTDIIMR